jgi:hypothetical protein
MPIIITLRILLILNILCGFSWDKNGSNSSAVPVVTLAKCGEIPNQFSNKEDDYFWRIEDLACDDENNLYVADSGWNKIFKFDSQGHFLESFGRAGQGPGEFMAIPQSMPLRISFGNDRKLYVLDSANQRISVFTKEGKFLNQKRIRALTYDPPQVNSRGDFFLISKGGKYVVDCFDSESKLKAQLLEYDDFYRYVFPSLPEPADFSRSVYHTKLLKAVGGDDHLYVVSNLSLTVFHYDQDLRPVNEFKIRNERILEDYRKRVNAAISKKGYPSAFIDLFVDKLRNLLHLCYYNGSSHKGELYRYRNDGTLEDILLVPTESRGIFAGDNLGNIYDVSEKDSIIMYRILGKKGGDR